MKEDGRRKKKDKNQEDKGKKAPTQTKRTSERTNRAAKLLANSVTKLMNSSDYKAALLFRKKLHPYSFRNVWLIYAQMPEASMIASYQKWQQLGRQVKKGETSLAILAPLIKKDHDTQEKEVFGFRSASVFDVSQTKGEPLPEMPQPTLLSTDNLHIQTTLKQLERYAKQQGNPVSYQTISANGQYNLKNKTIILNETLPPLQTLKTLIHELAHAIMHATITAEPSHTLELEAESCAFIVCDALELDSSAYSFAYLANWANNPDELVNAAQKACKAADSILEALPDTQAELALAA